MNVEAAPARANGPTHRPLRVLHLITRMIVGGAQETVILSCSLIDRSRFPSEILSGPETGVEGELHGESAARGVRLRIEPSLVRRVHPWLDLVALARITRLLRRERYDIVHTHSSKAGIIGRLAAALARVPVVVHTAHGWSFNPAQSRLAYRTYVQLERFCAPMCRAIVVVAADHRAEGLALGIGKPEQYVLIRSGIEIEFYRDVTLTRDAARARLGIPSQAFVVGTVGRLGPQKAPLDLLDAFEPVARHRPEAHLVFAGDGPQREQLEAAIRARGLGARVHVLGLRRDVAELLRAFDVFALASRWEGLPRVFPQAMAAGLPIVATRVDGAPDAIVPGENGWLIDPGDTPGFTARLLELAADPERARRMGECGRGRIDPFSATAMVRELERLYARLAHERGLWEKSTPARGT